jgi:uncharacterized membrane protein
MTQTAGRIGRIGSVVACSVISALLYSRLPEQSAIHWDAAGHPNGYAHKPWGPFTLPLILLAQAVVFEILPKISPRRYALESSARAYAAVSTATCVFLALIHVLILSIALGATLSVTRVVPAAVGLLFVIIGNYSGKTSKNFFLGIRTPWTLASDEVWSRTHRLAGKCWVIAGIALIVCSTLGYAYAGLMFALVLSAFIPSVYSYVLYRRLVGFDN